MSAPPDGGLDVVIVSYRCRELLRGCLASLSESPPSVHMRVIVVDNASEDGTVEMVRAEHPEAILRASAENLGFGAATNLGARLGESEFLLALNPDTRVTEGALDLLLERMREHPEVAVIGPRLLREDGAPDHAAKRSFPTPLSALGHFSGIGRRSGAKGALAAYRAPQVESGPVDAVNGAFMLMRREEFERLGGFDERYWMYMEDLDLSYRFAQAGLLSWYEPGAVVWHVKGGTTAGGRSPRLEWAFHAGMWRFYRDHYAPGRSRFVNAAVYAGIAVKLAAALAQAVWRSRRRALRLQRRASVPARDGGSGSARGPG